MNATPAKQGQKKLNPIVKFLLEMGPLLLFFFANARPKIFEPLTALVLPPAILAGKDAGLFTATIVLMIAAVTALIVSYALTKRLPIMPLVTAVLVLIFGALTLYLQDERFIKMKPTALYLAFGLTLAGGMLFNKPLLPIVLDNAVSLTEKGWRILTVRWAAFFIFLAILNEIVWRLDEKFYPDHPNDLWVAFKFPGCMILIFVFTMAQVRLIMRHELTEEAAAKAPDHL